MNNNNNNNAIDKTVEMEFMSVASEHSPFNGNAKVAHFSQPVIRVKHLIKTENYE